MKREILINANPRETRVAILEDDELVELLVDRPDARRMVGDIYLGKVEAVLPGLQAAFVDIGTEKSAFLHNSDLVYDEGGDEDDDDDDDDDDDGDDSEADEVATAAANGETEVSDSPYAEGGDATPAPDQQKSEGGRGQRGRHGGRRGG